MTTSGRIIGHRKEMYYFIQPSFEWSLSRFSGQERMALFWVDMNIKLFLCSRVNLFLQNAQKNFCHRTIVVKKYL